MGIDASYGAQKYWGYGATYDGMSKVASGSAGFKFGFVNDFVFPNDKQVAARVNCFASIVAAPGVSYHPTARAIGASTATVVRKLGGATPFYGQSRNWLYGWPTSGLLKKDAGQQTFWAFGALDLDIFAPTQAGLARGQASCTASAGVKFSVSGIAVGQCTPIVIRQLGGAIDTQGGQKYWSVGGATGMTFFALSNTILTTNKAKFADQSLWYLGLPTPDLVGTIPSAPSGPTTSPSRIISSSIARKRQTSGYPPGIKVVSAKVSCKQFGSQ